ncbi:MAG TPA: phage integrase N-terminal SAM-like domain-containing protein [Nitrospiraceae bacterium]|nr:phage integrase N-terminal SAM-like domain-containing protein [Nitrospiraceae bacterium]
MYFVTPGDRHPSQNSLKCQLISLRQRIGLLGVIPQEPNPSATLFDQVRDAIRVKHYSLRTEHTYLQWIRQFVGYHRRYPAVLGEQEVRAFLTHLARDRHFGASTQNQAFSAILYLFREVLKKDFGWLQGVDRAQNRERIPLVLSREEIKAVISRLASTPRLMAELLYCSGLRLMECVWLRVKDIDIPRRQLVVREGRAATIACRCVASVIARSSAIELIWRESKAPQPASELKHANPRLQQKRS